MTEPTRRTPSRRRILAGGGALAAIATLGGWVRDLTAADLSPAARGGTAIAPMQGTAPVLFIGHGSPMNAIRDNDYSRALVGSTQNVLVTGPSRRDPNEWTGKTGCNRSVNFAGPKGLAGQMLAVEITEALPNSLRGRLTAMRAAS